MARPLVMQLGLAALLAMALACTRDRGQLVEDDAGPGTDADAGNPGGGGGAGGSSVAGGSGGNGGGGGIGGSAGGGAPNSDDAGPSDAGGTFADGGGCFGTIDPDGGVCTIPSGCPVETCPASLDTWSVPYWYRFEVAGACADNTFLYVTEVAGMSPVTCYYDATTHQLLAAQYCTDTPMYCGESSSCAVNGTLPADTTYSPSYGASPGKDCTTDGGDPSGDGGAPDAGSP